jgi:hypothetical protein
MRMIQFTTIRENQCSRFQDEFSGFGILGNVSRETDGTGPLAGGVYSSRGNAVYVSEHLRLRSGRVTDHETVDVATEPSFARLGKVFGRTAKQHAQHAFFEIIVAPNGRGDRMHQLFVDIGTFGDFIEFFDYFWAEILNGSNTSCSISLDMPSTSAKRFS